MPQHALLISTHDITVRDFLADQFEADGHAVHPADSAAATTTTLCARAIDVVILGELETPSAALALLRSLRAGELHARVHPAQPVVTLGDADELATLRAYEAGSDHHLAHNSSYLVIRAVIAAVAQRALGTVTSRHVHVADLHIDTAARTADIRGNAITLSRTEFELLRELASDPTRVFSKAELLHAVWGYDTPQRTRTRTLDTHVCRLRRKLTEHGADGWVTNRWGHGYCLHTGT